MSIARNVRPATRQQRGTLCLTIAPGAPLPQPGAELTLDSPLSGLVYRVIIRSIVRLEWEYDQRHADEIIGVRVWVRGEKEVIER